MDHNSIRHMLSEYIDGSISAQDQAEIESHLKTCPQCSEVLTELQKTIEHVKSVEEIEPPAWMTQKVMVKVRAEAEGKRNWYQRIFFPLAVKLPIQAVAVLFLTVTAYYLYQSINPAEKFMQEPRAAAAKKDAPSIDKLAKEEKAIQAPIIRAKKMEQEPGYKAHDMKNEYEKSAPPVPAEQPAAPAAAPVMPNQSLARPAAGAGALAAKEQRSIAGVAQNETEHPEVAAKKAKAAAPPMQRMAITTAATKAHLTVFVNDAAIAEKEVERVIHELKGLTIRSETIDKSRRIIVSVHSNRLVMLQEKLDKLGEIKEKELKTPDREGLLQIEITLTPAPRP